jgi:hypothetical protein
VSFPSRDDGPWPACQNMFVRYRARPPSNGVLSSSPSSTCSRFCVTSAWLGDGPGNPRRGTLPRRHSIGSRRGFRSPRSKCTWARAARPRCETWPAARVSRHRLAWWPTLVHRSRFAPSSISAANYADALRSERCHSRRRLPEKLAVALLPDVLASSARRCIVILTRPISRRHDVSQTCRVFCTARRGQ